MPDPVDLAAGPAAQRRRRRPPAHPARGRRGGTQHAPALRGGPGWAPHWRLASVDHEGSAGAHDLPSRRRGARAGHRAGARRPRRAAGGARGHQRRRRRRTGSTGWSSRCRCPPRREELLDLTGRWCRERHPQRHPFTNQGTWTRDGRHGRTGHDATLLLVAGTPGFGNRAGSVWGVHLAWSGDHTSYAERRPDGRAVLGERRAARPGGGAAGRGRVLPDAGRPRGLVRRRARRAQRAAAPSRPGPRRAPGPAATGRPQHLGGRLLRPPARPADRARGRRGRGGRRALRARRRLVPRPRNDRAGLGDWVVDADVWPDGLGRSSATCAGWAWSSASGSSPRWSTSTRTSTARTRSGCCGPADDLPVPWRQQQVLDLAQPGGVRPRARRSSTRC